MKIFESAPRGARQINFSAFLVTLFLTLGLFSGMISAQNPGVRKSDFLLGVVFKLERLEDAARQEIRFLDGEIRKADGNIQKSENIIRIARERGNAEAERIAQSALAAAGQAKEKNLSAKSSLQTKLLQIGRALGAVRNELAKSTGNSQRIESMVASFTGRVSIQKSDGKQPFELDGSRPVFLEKGDVIVTYGGSVELQTLGGRGNLKIGEYTQIEIGESADAAGELIKLAKGKIDVQIENLDAFEKALEQKIKAYENDLKTVKDEFKQQMVTRYRAARKSIFQYRKRFEIQTPCIAGATRSTRFSVKVDDLSNTEVAVTEGSFELIPLDGTGKVIVNAGEKVFVSKEGKISKPVKIEAPKSGG